MEFRRNKCKKIFPYWILVKIAFIIVLIFAVNFLRELTTNPEYRNEVEMLNNIYGENVLAPAIYSYCVFLIIYFILVKKKLL